MATRLTIAVDHLNDHIIATGATEERKPIGACDLTVFYGVGKETESFNVQNISRVTRRPGYDIVASARREPVTALV